MTLSPGYLSNEMNFLQKAGGGEKGGGGYGVEVFFVPPMISFWSVTMSSMSTIGYLSIYKSSSYYRVPLFWL